MSSTSVDPERIQRLARNPAAVRAALRAQGVTEAPRVVFTPPTRAEAATMAIRGPWGGWESVAVAAPWTLVALTTVLFAVGSANLVIVIVAQVIASLITTGAVLITRYNHRRVNQ